MAVFVCAVFVLSRRALVIAADLLPAGCFLRALVHVPCIAAVVHDGRDREGDDGEAEQKDEHHADRAGQKPHPWVILIQDRQRSEHAGEDDR